ncbi:MAG: hypothetical protein NT034_00485 [Candidatus Magasanikbacteria bacterium]|nr:hypothetical protein [Candidatus Magasanikbacteria bacterium]
MKKIERISQAIIITIFTLVATPSISRLQPHDALAAQECSLHPFYGTVAYNGTIVDGADVTLTNTTKSVQILGTTTTNGGLYSIETANFNTCASVGDQILLSAFFNGFSTSTIMQYPASAVTQINLFVVSTPTTTSTTTATTTPTTTSTSTPTINNLPTSSSGGGSGGSSSGIYHSYTIPQEVKSYNQFEETLPVISTSIDINSSNGEEEIIPNDYPNHSILRSPSKKLYVYIDGTIWPVKSTKSLGKAYANAKLFNISNSDLKKYKLIKINYQNDVLLRSNTSKKIYYLSMGTKKHILNSTELRAYKNKITYRVSEAVLASYPTL